MIGQAVVTLKPGEAIVEVDGQRVPAKVSVTFKKDGSLSTLKVSTNL